MASATLNHQLSSRDVVAAAVDCGRQLLVMVSKFASPLRAVGSYEPDRLEPRHLWLFQRSCSGGLPVAS